MVTTPTPMSASQVRRPWRATIRTGFAVVVALAAMMPLLVDAAGLDETAGPVAGVLAIAGAITRVLALPQVETFLRRFLPWLAADPDDGLARRARAAQVAERNQRGHVDLAVVLLLGFVGLVALLATGAIPTRC